MWKPKNPIATLRRVVRLVRVAGGSVARRGVARWMVWSAPIAGCRGDHYGTGGSASIPLAPATHSGGAGSQNARLPVGAPGASDNGFRQLARLCNMPQAK